MKTIGKTLENDNAIVELTKKDVEMLLTSVNSYCVKLHNLGLEYAWDEYTSLEFKILSLKCNMK